MERLFYRSKIHFYHLTAERGGDKTKDTHFISEHDCKNDLTALEKHVEILCSNNIRNGTTNLVMTFYHVHLQRHVQTHYGHTVCVT